MSRLRRPLIYIAGPYSHPDPCQNTHDAVVVAEDILVMVPDVVPIIPHLSHFWHTMRPHDVDFWYELDIDILDRCDALYRFPGKSTGADNEMEYAREHRIPIFETYVTLAAWGEKWHEEQAEANGE